MHTLIKLFIPFILLAAALNAPSQTSANQYKLMYETTRDELYLTYLRLDSSRSILNMQSKQIENFEKEISFKDSLITNLKLTSKNSETESGLLKNELLKKSETNMLEFKGFYAGITAFYRFEDSVLTRQTILGGMKYDLTGTVKFNVNGVLDIETGLSIPIRNEKFAIIIKADWKIL
jgi:hypothetical protein